MENNIKKIKIANRHKGIKQFRCDGIIPKGRLQGKICGKVLIEPNSEGEIKGRLKCTRCKTVYLFE